MSMGFEIDTSVLSFFYEADPKPWLYYLWQAVQTNKGTKREELVIWNKLEGIDIRHHLSKDRASGDIQLWYNLKSRIWIFKQHQSP